MDDSSRKRLVAIPLLLALTHSLVGPTTRAEYHDNFEGPEPSWAVTRSDAKIQAQSHRRVANEAHAGNSSEFVSFVAGNGTQVFLEQRIPASRVIDDLKVSLWVKGYRPGITLYARAVLPRSRDPRTGEPVVAWLAGTSYQQAGIWQKLQLEQLPLELVRQARVLRSELGPQIDPREAYVDRIAINAFGGEGLNTLWIDDLRLEGNVDPHAVGVAGAVVPATWNGDRNDDANSRPQLRGGVVYVANRAILPRVLPYRGESIEDIAKLGFNLVSLPFVPSAQWETEARKHGLWLIAPAPDWTNATEAGSPRTYPRVMAWHLGEGLGKQQLAAVQQQAEQIRRRDPLAGRPLLAAPAAELLAYSRLADILVLGREPLGSTLDPGDYAQWLAWQSRLVRPGTPLWFRIQTDFSDQLTQQWNVGSVSASAQPSADPFQIRQLVWSSISASARGIWFESRSPLTEPTPNAQRRRLTLEWTNLDLAMIEPWATGEGFATSAESDDPHVRAAVLQTDRARLLLPTRGASGDQLVPRRTADGALTFVVPGVPESNEAYQLTPVAFEPLRHRRIAGGIRVSQQRYGEGSMILLTGDPRITGSFAARIQQHGPRAAQIVEQLAQLEWASYETIARHLAAGDTDGSLARTFQSAQQSLQQIQAASTQGDHARAFLSARRALALLGQAKHEIWEGSVASWPSPVTSPFTTSFSGVPGHWRLAQFLRTCRRLPNQLAAGDFEDLAAMQAAGWGHAQYPVSGLRSEVRISRQAPHAGMASLRLSVQPDLASDANNSEGVDVVETSPVWVTSPSVRIAAGDWIRISGFVKIRQSIQGSVDGLMIYDSLGGAGLAQRWKQAGDWQEFVFYRVAPADAAVQVTIALTGIGDAWIDDFAIEPLLAAPPQAAGLAAPQALTK
ncbi:MAG: hypothetical protein KDA42_02330 [Planctomycetales bacterium]|nr:hypothetical protein [Planctomycetales bacterium]